MILPSCAGGASGSQPHLVFPRPTTSSVQDDDGTTRVSFLSRALGSSDGGARGLQAAGISSFGAKHQLSPTLSLVNLFCLSLGLRYRFFTGKVHAPGLLIPLGPLDCRTGAFAFKSTVFDVYT
jgi:hypothetical protein